MNRPLCTQAIAVATIIAPTQKLTRLLPGGELRGYTGVGSTSEHNNKRRRDTGKGRRSKHQSWHAGSRSPAFSSQFAKPPRQCLPTARHVNNKTIPATGRGDLETKLQIKCQTIERQFPWSDPSFARCVTRERPKDVVMRQDIRQAKT